MVFTPGKPIVAGNWKMNGLQGDLAELAAMDSFAAAQDTAEVVICPPATLLHRASAHRKACLIGAQDCHQAATGAHTGNLSAAMVKEAGAALSIVGHSERRADQGECDADVKAKAEALQQAGMGTIVCVGEALEERENGDPLARVGDQLRASLPAGASAQWLAVAYEPIWAIGTGKVASLNDIAAMHSHLRGVLKEQLGSAGEQIAILYGGSVKPDNAQEIMALDDVGGVLVGGASLKADDFNAIIAAA